MQLGVIGNVLKTFHWLKIYKLESEIESLNKGHMEVISMDDVIEFVTTTETVNEIGDAIETPNYRQVFANKKSVRQTEFYQAAAKGLKPEIMFEVWTLEYQGEEKFRHNEKLYNIIRTYDRPDEMTEIVGTGLVNGGDS